MVASSILHFPKKLRKSTQKSPSTLWLKVIIFSAKKNHINYVVAHHLFDPISCIYYCFCIVVREIKTNVVNTMKKQKPCLLLYQFQMLLRPQKLSLKEFRESAVIVLPITKNLPRYVGIFLFKFVIKQITLTQLSFSKEQGSEIVYSEVYGHFQSLIFSKPVYRISINSLP